MKSRLIDELIELLGEDDFVRLCEKRGGLRIYAPKNVEQSKLVDDLGHDVLSRLQSAYSGDFLKVPLARHFRAHYYRKKGLRDREIAFKLGMTESGVRSIFKSGNTTNRAAPDNRQFELFNPSPRA